jgi:hypothetical protein
LLYRYWVKPILRETLSGCALQLIPFLLHRQNLW